MASGNEGGRTPREAGAGQGHRRKAGRAAEKDAAHGRAAVVDFDLWGAFVSVAGRMVVERKARKLVKIGARIVRHGRYLVFQLAEVAVPRALFAAILRRIDRLRGPPMATA